MIINVNNFSVSPAVTLVGVENSVPDSTLKIRFGKNWKGRKISVSFYKEDECTPVAIIPYRPGGISIPPEILSVPGVHKFIICEKKGDSSISSDIGYLSVIESASTRKKGAGSGGRYNA